MSKFKSYLNIKFGMCMDFSKNIVILEKTNVIQHFKSKKFTSKTQKSRKRLIFCLSKNPQENKIHLK